MSGKSELVMFNQSYPQIVIDSAIFSDVYPTTALGESPDNIEFVINGANDYIDLNDTLLYLRVSIKKPDGTALEGTSTLTPCNFYMNALFSDVQLSLNDVTVEGGDQMYAYKSTIASIFNFSDDAKRIQLLPMGFCTDSKERKGWMAESKQFELAGALRLDFLNQPKYLLPGVNVRLLLQRAKPAFGLLEGKTVVDNKVIIHQAKLFVRRVKVSQAVSLGHQIGLLKQNAIYPYTRSKVVSYAVSKGSLSYSKDNLFSTSLMPKFLVVGMVQGKAYNADPDLDPFKFEHFDVNSVGLYCDGQSVPYRAAYHPNFKKGLFTCDYIRSMIQNTEQLNTNFNNGVDMGDFKNGGYTFFTFNLTPDFDMTSVQQARGGNLRLELKFGTALAESINVVLYALFDAEVQITKDKVVLAADG